MKKRKRASREPAPAERSRLRELHPRRFFLETWARVDEEARQARQRRRDEGKGYDFRPGLVLALGAVLLALKHYYGTSEAYGALIEHMADGSPEDGFFRTLPGSSWYVLSTHAWWALWRILTYFVVPAIFVRVVLRERLRDHGLSLKGVRDDLWIYGLAFAVVLILVIAVSYDEAFTNKYPFYRLASRSWADFIGWELLYIAQFFSLEFFFRGHWLKTLQPTFGSGAIFVMVVPYCMVHFGKPLPETLAAIVAGVVLGTLAMKTRSIWNGFLIHSSVGISMDIASILRSGSLPDRFWP